MSDPFVAEIRMYPFNFPPTGWAQCDGQLMPLSQNTALFSLLGTFYGGDGKSNFALPDLKGSVPMHFGQGQGLSLRDLGELGGTETTTLLQSEIPAHTHQMSAYGEFGSASSPVNHSFALDGLGLTAIYGNTSSNLVAMHPTAVTPAGGSLPHNNMQPYLTLNFCIALQGIFPQRP